MSKKLFNKFTKDCGQVGGDKRVPNDPDVPKENSNSKEEQDPLPTKSKKKRKS